MIKTIPSVFTGETNLGYALLTLLSENAKYQVTELLKELSQELYGIITPMPPEQLHITLCEIIQLKDYSQDKNFLFTSHQKEYKETPAQILSNTPSFSVTFDTTEASPQAIIIKASNTEQFNHIRAKLITNMQLPEETRTPPDITHSSIARYQKEVDLKRVQEVVATHQIKIEAIVSEFMLIRNDVPPLQNYEVLRTYPLRNIG